MAKPNNAKTNAVKAAATPSGSPRQFTSSEVYFDHEGRRHRPGKVFTLPAGVRPGKSMTEVGKAKEAPAEPAQPETAEQKAAREKAQADAEAEAKAGNEPKAPETLSELAKIEHKAQGDDALV